MELPACPTIPEEDNNQLVQSANEATKAIVPALRQQLGLSSIGAEVDPVTFKLSGKELVHTAYFDNSDVLDLVAEHICWAARGDKTKQETKHIEWIQNFKNVVAEVIVRIHP